MPRIAAAARELCQAAQADVAIRDAGRETLEIRYGAGTGSVGGGLDRVRTRRPR
jgi:hypothetical protein